VVELLVILLLVALNGMLAGAELALVSARKSRLERLAGDGSGAAQAALALRAVPERLLATIQVGITLIGAVAAAFGGSTLALRLADLLRAVPALADVADGLAFALVVVLITYLSVVFGELVPKSLALRGAERYALLVARPMRLLAWVGRPVVWLFAASSNLVLRLFHDRTSFLEGRLSREDIEAMVHEARTTGALDPSTSKLVVRALEFADLRVDDVMVHRRAVVAVPETAGEADLREAMLVRGHRRIPVFGRDIDDVRGYVLRDDVMGKVWDREALTIPALLRQPLFLPESMPATSALEEMRRGQRPLAVVLEEHGGMAGIVTIEDLVEELVGEIFHERDAVPPDPVLAEAPGVFLVLGAADVRLVEERIGIELPEATSSRSLSGLLVEMADGRLPHAGETLALGPCRVEVLEVSPRRVRRVRITVPASARSPAPAPPSPV
jgi:putative hemolysin